MGHLNKFGLKKFQKLADVIKFKSSEVYIQKSIHGIRVPVVTGRAKHKQELVHTDVRGQFLKFPRSVVADDATRRVVIYTLETKDQTLEAYEEFMVMTECQTNNKLKIQR